MDKPLLTIATVTRNCRATLGRTLQSVAAVKDADVEYVVVDGASTDGTIDLIKEHGGLVDRFVSEPDSGIYNAMNKAASLASGQYILFINGDDELLPAGFPAVKKVMESGAGEVICAATLVGSTDAPSEVLVAQRWLLFFFNTIPHPSTFVATRLVKQYGFREDLRVASDYDLFLRLFLGGHGFALVNATTALHHRGGASADSALTSAEIERVRRDRLGWLYPLTRAIHSAHRWRKRLLAGVH